MESSLTVKFLEYLQEHLLESFQGGNLSQFGEILKATIPVANSFSFQQTWDKSKVKYNLVIDHRFGQFAASFDDGNGGNAAPNIEREVKKAIVELLRYRIESSSDSELEDIVMNHSVGNLVVNCNSAIVVINGHNRGWTFNCN